jgi:hypothetical protein
MKSVNVKSKYIYTIALCVLSFLFVISYSKYKIKNETKQSGVTIKVIVLKVACDGVINNKNYIVFSYNNSNHIVNLNSQSCNNYNVGDTLSLVYNKKYDLYFRSQIDATYEKWGMILQAYFYVLSF